MTLVRRMIFHWRNFIGSDEAERRELAAARCELEHSKERQHEAAREQQHIQLKLDLLEKEATADLGRRRHF